VFQAHLLALRSNGFHRCFLGRESESRFFAQPKYISSWFSRAVGPCPNFRRRLLDISALGYAVAIFTSAHKVGDSLVLGLGGWHHSSFGPGVLNQGVLSTLKSSVWLGKSFVGCFRCRLAVKHGFPIHQFAKGIHLRRKAKTGRQPPIGKQSLYGDADLEPKEDAFLRSGG
jgi:hypothetical protein